MLQTCFPPHFFRTVAVTRAPCCGAAPAADSTRRTQIMVMWQNPWARPEKSHASRNNAANIAGALYAVLTTMLVMMARYFTPEHRRQAQPVCELSKGAHPARSGTPVM
eukprot:2297877-Lingulodinium_polyedra.AAC.1